MSPFRKAGNGGVHTGVAHREHVPAWRSNIAIRRRGRLRSVSSCGIRDGGGGEHHGSLVHGVGMRGEAGLIQADGNAEHRRGAGELDDHGGAPIAVARVVGDGGPESIE